MDSFGDEIKEIDFWTDGPSSQYKNKYVFAFFGIKLPEIFLSLRICWNYSATSHGKGAVDGVVGTIKHLATRAIITRKAIVINADSLLKACPLHCSTASELTKQHKDAFLLCEDTSFTIHSLLSCKNPTVTKSSKKQLAVGDYVIVKYYDEEFYPSELIALGEYAKVCTMIKSEPKY